jgi:hypothetical protein
MWVPRVSGRREEEEEGKVHERHFTPLLTRIDSYAGMPREQKVINVYAIFSLRC